MQLSDGMLTVNGDTWSTDGNVGSDQMLYSTGIDYTDLPINTPFAFMAYDSVLSNGLWGTVSFNGASFAWMQSLFVTTQLFVTDDTLLDSGIIMSPATNNIGTTGDTDLITLAADEFSVSGEVKASAGINVGDSGGFSGLKFNAGDTQLEVYIDGTKIGHFSTDGTYTDDVS
jgi:hypothetical protein